MASCSITCGRRARNRNQFIFPHSRMDMKVLRFLSVSQSGTEAPAPSSEVTLTRIRGILYTDRTCDLDNTRSDQSFPGCEVFQNANRPWEIGYENVMGWGEGGGRDQTIPTLNTKSPVSCLQKARQQCFHTVTCVCRGPG